MTTADPDVNREVKAKFNLWAKEIDLPGKLRTMRMAKCQDGEGFCVQSNRGDHASRTSTAGGSPVPLEPADLRGRPMRHGQPPCMFSVPRVDGIELDEHFQPKNFFILRIHPGNYVYLPGYVGFPWDYDTFPASKVCHWYRKDRPELHRGIPEIDARLEPLRATPRLHQLGVEIRPHSMRLGHQRRRPTPPPGLQDADGRGCRRMDTFEFEDGMAMTMPAGWEAKGLNPTFPDANIRPSSGNSSAKSAAVSTCPCV